MTAHHGQAEDLVRTCLEEMGFSPSGIAPDQILEDDPGLDSIEVVELVAMVVKRAGFPAETPMPTEALTIGGLAQHLEQPSAAPAAKAG